MCRVIWAIINEFRFPSIYCTFSRIVTFILIPSTLIILLQRVIYLPFADTATTGLSAFGITAALAAICASIDKDSFEAKAVESFRYAFRDFLHASLLLLQLIFLSFVRDALRELSWVQNSNGIKTTISAVVVVLMMFLGMSALLCWSSGLHRINELLWQQWKQRAV